MFTINEKVRRKADFFLFFDVNVFTPLVYVDDAYWEHEQKKTAPLGAVHIILPQNTSQ